MKLVEYDLPAFWESALINGDMSGYSDDEEKQIDAFIDSVLAEYGSCHCIGVDCDSTNFRAYHDAKQFGVLACDVETYTFDVQ